MSETPEPQAPPREPPGEPQFAGDPSPVARFQAELGALTPRVYVTWILFAANLAVFGAMLATGVSALDPSIDSLLMWGADYGPKTLAGEWWRLVTNAFLHIGALHLGMNMLVLATTGPFVERLFGNLGFVSLYFAAALAGSITSIVWAPEVVSAGASGAIFGLYGGLMGFALRNKHSIPRAAFLQLLQRAGTFVAINVVYAFSQKHIDMAAHVGGLFGGFLAGLALARPLTPAGAARRWIGAAAVLATTVAMVAVAVVAIPPPVDVDGAINHAVEAEKRALASLDAALGEVETAGTEATATRIEREAIGPWDAEIVAMEGVEAPSGARERVADVLRIMKERRRLFAEIAAAVRADDVPRFERAVAELTKQKPSPKSGK